MQGLRCVVQCLGFWVQGSWLRVKGSGVICFRNEVFPVPGPKHEKRVPWPGLLWMFVSGFRVYCSGLRVHVSGFRIGG